MAAPWEKYAALQGTGKPWEKYGTAAPTAQADTWGGDQPLGDLPEQSFISKAATALNEPFRISEQGMRQNVSLIPKLEEKVGRETQEEATRMGLPPEAAGFMGAAAHTIPDVAMMGDLLTARGVKAAAEGIKAIPSIAKSAYEDAGKLAGNLSDKIGNFYDIYKGKPAESAAEQLKGGSLERLQQAKTRATQVDERLEAQRQAAIAKAEQHSAEAQKHLQSSAFEPVADEHMGAFIQQEGAKNLKAEHAKTIEQSIEGEKDPAFLNARIRAAAGDTPSTNPKSKPILDKMFGQMEQQIKDIPPTLRGNMEKNLQDLKNENLTLHQLEGLRRFFEEPTLYEKHGFGAMAASDMIKNGKLAREAEIAYEQRVGDYIEKYSSGKKAEEAMSGGKKGKVVTKSDAEADGLPIFNMKPQSVASYYLDGTKTSAEKLVRLAGQDRNELSLMVRGNLRGKMEGLNAEQAEKFLKNNQGLFEVFPEAKAPLQAYAKSMAEHERILSSVKTDAEKIGHAGVRPQSLAEKYAGQITKLESITNPKEMVSSAKSIMNSMKDSGAISNIQYQDIARQIDDAHKKFGDTEKAKKAIMYALKASGVVAGYEILGHTGIIH